MLLKYPLFFQRYGVRKTDQLARPPLGRIEHLSIPVGSVYHYVGTKDLDDGPTEAIKALAAYSKQFPTRQVFETPTMLGNPRKLTVNADQQFVRGWRLRHPRFRPFNSFEVSDRDLQQLVVFNYSYIPRLYRYIRSFYTGYYRTYNHLAAVFDGVGTAVQQTERQHFIEFPIPQVLPSVSLLQNAETDITRKAVPFFSSIESLMVLELWRWLGKNRSVSMLNRIPRDRLHKVNLVFTDAGRWMMFNLGLLDTWRIPMPAELEGLDEQAQKDLLRTKGRTIQAGNFQRRALHALLLATEARGGDVAENLGDGEGLVSVNQETTNQAETIKDAGPSTPVTPTPSTVPVSNVEMPEELLPEALTEAPEFGSVDRDFGGLAFKADQTDAEYSTVLADLERLETLAQASDLHEEADPEHIVAGDLIEDPMTPEEAIRAQCALLAESGSISAKDFKYFEEQAGAYRQIAGPDGGKLGDFIKIPTEMVKIDKAPAIQDTDTITDKSMLSSTLMEFDSRYVTSVMQRDIANMVVNLQQAGILVLGYDVEEIEDISGSYLAYRVKVKPVQGLPSTLTFNMPKVQPNGTFRVNGVNYHTRKQRGDLPIRKLNPARVQLTSYYGKVFVDRSEKKVNDYGRFIRDAVMRIGLEDSDGIVTDLVPGNAFDPSVKLPRLYTIFAQGFRAFKMRVVVDEKSRVYDMHFDHKTRGALIGGNELLANYEEDGCVVCGRYGRELVVIGSDSGLYTLNMDDESRRLYPMPYIEDILDIRALRTPIDQADVSLYGKAIPSGVVLGYLLGLNKLIKRLGVTPRRVAAGNRVNLEIDEYGIVFQDETWVFNKKDALATLVLAGWRDFEQSTKQYPAAEFSRKNVYLNAFDDNGLGSRHLREITLINQLFLGHIERELLAEMGEPQTVTELILRSAELLLTEDHPHELDARYMRVKGYERFAGILYSELVRAVRNHRSRANRSAHPVEMNPLAVTIAISQDSAKNQVTEINPIMDLKVGEALTYSGHGGRMSRSMVKRTRAYHPSDMGTVSEATVDASDVAINVLLSANPKFNSLRGTTNPYELSENNTTSLFSTSALLAPSANKDDAKRTNFISIQNGHGVACDGYHAAQVRTGYEQVIGHRTGDLYCTTAKQPGVVKSKTPTGIIVENADGTMLGVELGRRYGSAAGLTIPHEVVSMLKVGDTLQVGDVIAYNSGFFEPDLFDAKRVVFKMGMTVRVALLESANTLEDSSEISSKLARKLMTKMTKTRCVTVPFDTQIHRMVKPGERVEYESILCLIEDAVSAGSNLLDKESLDTLRVLGQQHPTAKQRGVVDRIEVYYNGDPDDMSESLQALTIESDKALIRRSKSAGRTPFTGSVTSNFRVENEPLLLDTAVIKIYITADVPAGVGDKGVFANQLKTVFGRVFDNVKTESGKELDAIFGALSVDNRIVTSPFTIGTTTSLLNFAATKVVAAYRS
jgi:hypothetical protein